MTLSKKNSKDINFKYGLLVNKLYDVCNELLLQNERCVLRINKVKNLLNKQQRDKAILKRRLAKHKDNWRSVPVMMAPHPKRKIEQKRGPKPKAKLNLKNTNADGNSMENSNKGVAGAPARKKAQRKQQPKKQKTT